MIIRLLILALLAFLVYTLWTAIRRSLTGGPENPPRKSGPDNRRGEEMVQDPECGTYIPRNEAVEASIGGRRLYFCSKACREAYQDRNR